MELDIVTPDLVLKYYNVTKIKAEGLEGCFTILPRHLDYTSVLIPCIIKFESDEAIKEIAVGEGILIKRGNNVKAAVSDIVTADTNGTLKSALTDYMKNMGEEERKEREIMAKLEAEIIRNFMMGK